jgi:hypothetical protein
MIIKIVTLVALNGTLFMVLEIKVTVAVPVMG